MKTYAEQEGKNNVFDWNAFFAKKEYTQKELNDAADRSNEWTSCATGNMCAIIPRDEDGVPTDDKLADLGSRFADIVNNMADALDDIDDHEIETLKVRLDEAIKRKKENRAGNQKELENYKKKAIALLDKIEIRSDELIKKAIVDNVNKLVAVKGGYDKEVKAAVKKLLK